MDEPGRADVRDWLRKARDDLAVARMVAERRGPAAVGCFLCQQALEKLLKAHLLAIGIDPPRDHDLTRLARRLAGVGRVIDPDDDRLAALSQYAVAPRYPGFPDERADEDLPGFVAFAGEAEALVTAALARLDPAL